MVKYVDGVWTVNFDLWRPTRHIADEEIEKNWKILLVPFLICEIRDEITQFLTFSEGPIGNDAWFLLHNSLWIDFGGWWHFRLPQEGEHSVAGWRCGYWIGFDSSRIFEPWSFQEEEELLPCSDSWNRYFGFEILVSMFDCSCLILFFVLLGLKILFETSDPASFLYYRTLINRILFSQYVTSFRISFLMF